MYSHASTLSSARPAGRGAAVAALYRLDGDRLLLEGGYALGALARSVAATIAVLAAPESQQLQQQRPHRKWVRQTNSLPFFFRWSW
jgi:acetoin utilization deacetylase AcuC-like enzyme